MSVMDGMTERQEQVLREIATGKPMRLIAASLGISPRGAKHHSDNLRRIFGVGTSRELIAVAQDHFARNRDNEGSHTK